MLRGVCQRAASLLLQTQGCAAGTMAATLPTTALPSVVHQAARGTCVFKRMFPIPGRKTGPRRILRFRHMVYIMEETRSRKPAGNIDLLLVDDVEGVGSKGELVTVTKNVARNQLLPSGAAIYPTEENVARVREEMKNEPERPRQSLWAQKTINQLAKVHLFIPMSPVHPWTLDKSHVRIAFRKQGIEVGEECLELPEESITQPQELVVNVTVNKSATVPVLADVFHYYKEDAHILPGFSTENFIKEQFRT